MNIFNIAEKLIGHRFAERLAAQIVDQYEWARRLRWVPKLFDAAEEYANRSGLTVCKFCQCLMTDCFTMDAHIACRNFTATLPRILVAVSWREMNVPTYLTDGGERTAYFRRLVQGGNPFRLSPFMRQKAKYTFLAA